MAETDSVDAAVADPAETVFRDEDGYVSKEFVGLVETALEADDREATLELAGDLHEADLGDLIETLHPEDQANLVRLLGDAFDFAVLTELDDSVRARLLEEMPAGNVAEGISELDSDDAVYILEDLPQEDQEAILQELKQSDRLQLRRALDYPEESAGRRMQSDFVAVPPFWTVGQTIDYLRESDALPDDFYQIYVIDPGFRLMGTVALDKLLRTKRNEPVSGIMGETVHAIKATEDQEEVATTFERYNLISAAVVDDSDRLVGVLTVDDIVDVIQAEAEEDIFALAGVGGDAEISDSIVETVRGRFVWLLVNLGTAVLASMVIGLFDATIQQMVALAVLMPIVASMGGNAGTQTMTVAVRALATRDLGSFNTVRIILRETAVGLINGVLFAVLMGLIAAFWFHNEQIGGLIAAAMIINMLAAGMAGILIPLALDKLDIDPAVASSVFVTTVTDVVGFFAFLGLAAWWFVLP
ncbi:magnesium transporter [Breoghania corrubedonensis]|uniref:Magnesium transporter MgtE n=1 Tax=Breoghania corrubedonensis TaxID=665038 RepID=A0A2T5VCM4_9HYPH|nr:magnesium transporter [Breoghania corrubedonensis]PTW61511.1 magnesium transporter [Breoghania corrubedonensis]